MLGDDKLLKIQGVYNTLYNARTRPDFKFVLTRYFIDEWVPVLGPSLAWLVVGLRQQCFWNRRHDWCIVDKETLSNETGLDGRTIERCLKKPLSHWFVIEVAHRYRYRHQIGKKVRDKNRYQLLLDEPLSPRHQIGLRTLLQEVAISKDDHMETALVAVQRVIETPHLLDKISYTGVIPKDLQRQTVLDLTSGVFDLSLEEYATDERVIKLEQQCTNLYNLIVQPNKIYVGWQYFRLKWVPLLGHALAWLIILMRRNCFWDEQQDELRDEFVVYKKDLAAAIGQTTRNLANLMDNPHTPLFFTTLNPNDTRNKPTHYRVRMVDEPLTPDDQQGIANELQQRLQGNFFGIDPESGQLNLFPILDKMSDRQNFAYGQVSEKMPVGDAKNFRLERDVSEKMPQHAIESIGKNAATLHNDSFNTSSLNKLIEQQEQTKAVAQLKGLKTLLDDLAIQEPIRSRLLANADLSVAKIGAWFLYAETQPNLFDPRSYVIKRLLANDPPPQEFLMFAKLNDSTWSLFEDTVQRLKQGQSLLQEINDQDLEIFIKWAEVYGGLQPEETRRLLALSDRKDKVAKAASTATGSQSENYANPETERVRQIWWMTLEQLQLQMTQQTFNTWLKPTEVLDYQDDVIIVDAKNSYAKEWLETRLRKVIERTLSSVAGKPMTVHFSLLESS